MPIGSAEIDFEGIAEKLSEFDETITMEVFTQDKGYLNLSLEKLKESF